jgi:hypothetical protein
MKTDCVFHTKYNTNKMSSKYVPPHMRNNRTTPSDQNPEPEKNPSSEMPQIQKMAEERASSWGGKKTFASLAAEWDEHAKIAELDKQQEEKDTTFNRKTVMPLPRFHNVRRFVESEEEESVEDQPQQTSNPDDEGWVLVDRKKYRREKTLEEKLNRPPTPENDGTVWDGNAPEEHETCWDQRY